MGTGASSLHERNSSHENQVEEGPSQMEDEQVASQSLLASKSVEQPQKGEEQQTEHSYDTAPERTPSSHVDNTRKVPPNILQRMRQFENNDNEENESGEGSSQDSDNEFYSQYVQGTKPRNFGGLPKDRNDEQMIVGDGDTTIDPNADLHENSDNVSA